MLHFFMNFNKIFNLNLYHTIRPIFKPTLYKLPTDMQVFLRQITCCLCKKLPPPPIKVCERGHLCCRDCAKIVPSCSWEPPNNSHPLNMCRKEFKDVELQFYNHLYRKSQFVCPNSDKGCDVKPLGEDLEFHSFCCLFKVQEAPDFRRSI